MSISPINSLASTSATDPAATTAVSDPLTDKNTFIQLLVAQLKNQDPLTPQDGTQFVAQLAQFSSLEANMQMRDDLGAISGTLTKIQGLLTPAPTAAPDPTTSN